MTAIPPRENSVAGREAGSPAPRNEPAAPWAVRMILPAVFTVLLILILRPVLRMDGLESLWKIAKVLVGLGFVIFIHELGHFLVAKWCDVHVQTFSIGFGPALPGCSFQWGETLYKIALFPLGGYVKMVGEGAEDEESADDPRSFKKKSVGQRMTIISAGVIMNVILAGACFSLVYKLHGVMRPPAEVAAVEAGSPVWQAGIPTGARIVKIGNVEHPYFEDLLYKVMHSKAKEKLTLVFEARSQPPTTIAIEPRLRKGDDQPLIGLLTPHELRLATEHEIKILARKGLPPVRVDSAANQAAPSFTFGDQIIGTTDPDNPATIKELPPNPFAPDRKDYYEFYKRLKRLEGKPMVMQVRRDGAGPDAPPVSIEVPASYHYTFGMRMRMGQITAVRDGSSAAAQGVVVRDAQQSIKGDIIKHVEVVDPDGSKTRFVTDREKAAPAKDKDKVKEVDVDPMRLPYELERWAERQTGPKKVALTVLREVKGTVFQGPHYEEFPLELIWADSWRFNCERQTTPLSPMSIPELGIAYRVECQIEAVEPDSPAAKSGLKEGDVIKAIRFQEWDADQRQAVTGSQWYDLDLDQWAWSFDTLQRYDFKQVTLRVKRETRDNQPGEKPQPVEITLTAKPDLTWPLAERGLIRMPDLRLQKADGLGSAIALGFERTYDSIIQTLQHVRAMFTGRVSATKSLNGPLGIAAIAYHFAGEGFFEFLKFLGFISVSLAVINFLPIPILDGGHMAFLTYEKIRGKPAPEQFQVALMYVGLLVILSLMIFTFWVDLNNWNILKFLFGK